MKYIVSIFPKLSHWVVGVFLQHNRIAPFIFPTFLEGYT
jgi:hypothetical protein